MTFGSVPVFYARRTWALIAVCVGALALCGSAFGQLVGWGTGVYGVISTPPAPTNVKQIAAGQAADIFLYDNGAP
jgi:hypothetical protein